MLKGVAHLWKNERVAPLRGLLYDEPESLEEKGLQFWKGKGSRHPVDPETDYEKPTQKVKLFVGVEK